MYEQRRNFGVGTGKLFPPVIKGLLIANVAVFLFVYMIAPAFSLFGAPLIAVIQHYFALQPFEWFTSRMATFMPWQLLSYQFLHGNFVNFDSGFFHLFFNMFGLWMFGQELEQIWGGKKFLIFYLLAGIGAGLTQLFIPFLGIETGPTVGASGALYGILLAFGLSFPNRQIFMFPLFIPIKAKYFIVIFAGLEMLMGFAGSDGVAHFAHLGGAATGFLLLFIGKRIGMPTFKTAEERLNSNVFGNYYQEEQKKQPAKIFQISFQKSVQQNPIQAVETAPIKAYTIDGEIVTQGKIDEILDKISASGYQKLTEREKHILTELSKKL